MPTITSGIFAILQAAVDGTSLTTAEKKLVGRVLDKPTKTLELSISELAADSGVSEATIVRTCQRLGYKGYPEFKLALAADLYQRPHKARPSTILGDIDSDDDLSTIVSKIFGTNIEVLSRAFERLDRDRFEQALSAILRARRVLVFSTGTQAHLVDLVCSKFSGLGIDCVGRVDHFQQIAAAAVAGPKDVLLVFSHSGRARVLVHAAQTAKAAGATTIGVTTFERSTLAKLVDIPLVTHGRDLAYYREMLASHLVQMVLIDCLVVGIVSRRKDEVLPKIIRAREAMEEYRM
ncbi:MAG TPA: MurR/RpiR family transcriptional regulator [bacterium]|nr:MurR/RpiR family transcriptional regulator [bacterium]